MRTDYEMSDCIRLKALNCDLGLPGVECNQACARYIPNDLHVPNELRTACEVYTRVMGYHRPVVFFNEGKKQEFADRRMFTEPVRPGACHV